MAIVTRKFPSLPQTEETDMDDYATLGLFYFKSKRWT